MHVLWLPSLNEFVSWIFSIKKHQKLRVFHNSFRPQSFQKHSGVPLVCADQRYMCETPNWSNFIKISPAIISSAQFWRCDVWFLHVQEEWAGREITQAEFFDLHGDDNDLWLATYLACGIGRGFSRASAPQNRMQASDQLGWSSPECL